VFTPFDLDVLLAPLAPYKRVALAVSGGGDSIALMRLTRDWAQAQADPPEIFVFTVDHGLRTGSRDEAEWVGAQAAKLGLPHQILTWSQGRPGASQEEARSARYALMAEYARAQGIDAIVTAHTSDDVAETFIMRLGRGSGVDGLAAMARESAWDGVSLVRPLLDISRAQLRAELAARGAEWLEDPSNADERYERVRVRRALDTLAELGLTRAYIMQSATRLRRTREAIEASAGDFIASYASVSPAGYVSLSRAALRATPEDIALHALRNIFHAVGGHERPPRLRKLEMLMRQLRRGDCETTTLGGCVISEEARAERLVFCREPGRLDAPPLSLSSGEAGVWDRRFRVHAEKLGREKVRVDSLGVANLSALPQAIRAQHPPEALVCLPAIYAGKTLLGVPVAGFATSDQHPDATACKASFLGLTST
jgi:tRNA(Ile)-lysidine synthase